MTIEETISLFERHGKFSKEEGLHETQEYYGQLAAWLRELQERRKMLEIIYCHECIRRRKNTETGEYYCRASGLRNTDYDFCSGGKRAEGRTDE